MSIPPQLPKPPSSTATLVAGMVALVVTIGAYIACEAAKINSAPVIAVAGPVIAALLLRDGIQRVEAKTDEVRKQTNGLLTGDGGAIEAAVERVLERRAAAVIPTSTSIPATVELVTTPPSASTSSTAL